MTAIAKTIAPTVRFAMLQACASMIRNAIVPMGGNSAETLRPAVPLVKLVLACTKMCSRSTVMVHRLITERLAQSGGLSLGLVMFAVDMAAMATWYPVAVGIGWSSTITLPKVKAAAMGSSYAWHTKTKAVIGMTAPLPPSWSVLRFWDTAVVPEVEPRNPSLASIGSWQFSLIV